MSEQKKSRFVEEDEATAKLMAGSTPITVIGVKSVRDSFEDGCLAQATTMANAPGIDEFVLNPDAHVGYGTPVGSVFRSKDTVYPCAVGPDISCSMSFLQLNIPSAELNDRKLRRAIIDALEERIPMGPGGHMPKKARALNPDVLNQVAVSGATVDVLRELGIPTAWSGLCEDATHGDSVVLAEHLNQRLHDAPALGQKLLQLGGVGGGNHFMECSTVSVQPGTEDIAQTFGLRDGYIGFLNHFGSRGFGFMLTEGGRGWRGQFRTLSDHFKKWYIPFPGGDDHNVYCPEGTPEFTSYVNDMYMGANFATVNHLLVSMYVIEAFREVMGSQVVGTMVYHIAHNIIRREIVDKAPAWVHRKGATRALSAGSHELKGTPFEKVGHPILLPGNPVDGSTIMVGLRGSRKALNSVNHGAGRAMSRRKANETFRQKDVDAHFEAADILTNCRQYPLDESPRSYKAYAPVIESVEKAGLARTVAKLTPRMLLKDSDQSRETSA